MIPPRTQLVPVSADILSSYGPGGATDAGIPRSQLRPLAGLGDAGRMTPDAAAGLLALHHAVLDAGGDLRITDCLRSVAQQQEARLRYERWLAAGSPKPSSSVWNPKTMKSAFVAKPGRSFHNSGRSIDIHIAALRFPGLPPSEQLDRLWDVAKPLGWHPIIAHPEERASEAWHFDFLGEWAPVRERVGYESTAIAAAADVGNGEPDGGWRRIQGGLQRAGYDCGQVDGMVGRKTEGALYGSGYQGLYSDIQRIARHVDALPSSATKRWTTT